MRDWLLTANSPKQLRSSFIEGSRREHVADSFPFAALSVSVAIHFLDTPLAHLPLCGMIKLAIRLLGLSDAHHRFSPIPQDATGQSVHQPSESLP